MTSFAKFSDVPSALDAFRRGEMLCVMDDENRENEGDIIMAAEFATPERMGLIIRFTSGILCAPMLQDRAEQLQLTPMCGDNNEDAKGTAFTVTCDAVGTTTGVGRECRAFTFNQLASPNATAKDITRPGHIFPLIARDGGVLEREGHTEATTDLCLLSGCQPVGVIGELTNDDGTMMRLPHVARFADRFGMKLLTIEQLMNFRRERGLLAPLQPDNVVAVEVTKRFHEMKAEESRQKLALQAGLSPSNGRQGEDEDQAAAARKQKSKLGLRKGVLDIADSDKLSLKVGIVRGLWNDALVSSLVQETKTEMEKLGLLNSNIVEVAAPGTFELPLATQKMASEGNVDAILCLGLLVKPSTIDFETTAQTVSAALMQVQLDTRVPVVYGVLNCLTVEQAEERCRKGSSDARTLAITTLYQAHANRPTKHPTHKSAL